MIYLVSGFMRCGTSMMCQCLEAGGMEVVRSERRDHINHQASDKHYKPNPISLYEPDTREFNTPGFPRQYDGKVLKMVAPWLKWLSVHEYKAIFMHRDVEEIRQSIEGAFGTREFTTERIEKAISESVKTLKNRRDVVEIIHANYRDVVENPLAFFESLDWPLDPDKSASVVDESQYRYRLEQLTVGI